jgi:sugar phosphate isomerase/epimerase
MKLSIVVSTQPASFEALAYKGQLNQNLAHIKRLGYDGVELAVRDPGSLDLDELQRMLQEFALPVAAIGTGQAYGEEGLSLTHSEQAIRNRAIERIKAQLRLAESLHSLVIIGLIRGKIERSIPSEKAEAWLREALQECAAENCAVKLAIEPLNRYESNLLNTVEAGLKFLDRLAADNLGLLLDTFHMNIEEPSILQSIESAKDRLFHFHVADSNRWYPGAGHIDFGSIIDTLEGIDYQGYLSAEIMPYPDPDTAAQEAVSHLRRFIPGRA